VPKFFDNVLTKRATEAVTLKGHWWDARREVALEGIKERGAAGAKVTTDITRVDE
jgi:hypothetical protein